MKKNLLKIYEGVFDNITDDLDKLNPNKGKDEFGEVNRDVYSKHDYILSPNKNPEFFKGLCNFCEKYKIYFKSLIMNENGFVQEDLDQITFLTYIPSDSLFGGRRTYSYFENVTSLDELKYFHNLNFIYKYTFSYCTKLKSVIFPKNLYQIDFRAFEFCTSLKELIFPKKIKTIYNFSFYGCKSLEKIVIPLRFKNFIEDLFTYVDLTKVNITYI